MGLCLNKCCWGGNPDEPDSISGLSLHDIHRIQKTWKPVFVKNEIYGMELLKRFFRAEPETKTYFKTIKDLIGGELVLQFSTNSQFRAHATHLMTYLNMMITSLNHPEMVVPMCYRLGDAHKRNSIPKKYFIVLKNVLVNFLVADLKLNDTYVNSWAKFVGFIYPNIFSRLDGN